MAEALPARGTLWVTPDGTAYRLRDYSPDWEADPIVDTIPSYGISRVNGMSSTTGDLPADARLVWSPDTLPVPQYVGAVYETRSDNYPGTFDLRFAAPDLDTAKGMLEAEVGAPLPWHDEFGGAIAKRHGLTYDIRPTRTVHLPEGA